MLFQTANLLLLAVLKRNLFLDPDLCLPSHLLDPLLQALDILLLVQLQDIEFGHFLRGFGGEGIETVLRLENGVTINIAFTLHGGNQLVKVLFVALERNQVLLLLFDKTLQPLILVPLLDDLQSQPLARLLHLVKLLHQPILLRPQQPDLTLEVTDHDLPALDRAGDDIDFLMGGVAHLG